MTGLPPAKFTNGTVYVPDKRYAGNGVTRSCNKCGKHKPIAGWSLLRPWGMVCKECLTKP